MGIRSGYIIVWTTGLSSVLHMLWKLRALRMLQMSEYAHLPLFWCSSHSTFGQWQRICEWGDIRLAKALAL